MEAGKSITDDDLSSAAEEEEKRRKARGKPKRKIMAAATAASASAIPPTYSDCKSKDEQPPRELKFRPFTEFIEENKHMSYENPDDAMAVCEKSASYFNHTSSFASLGDSLSSLSSNDANCGYRISEAKRRAREEHKRMVQSKPADSVILQALLQRCFAPVFHPENLTADWIGGSAEAKTAETSEKAMSDRLEGFLKRSQQVSLPHFTASYDQSMLYEAGGWVIGGKKLVFPACRNGEECIAKKIDFPIVGSLPSQTGFSLMAFMYPDQHKRFLDTGIPPNSRNPCLLCVRDSLTQLVCHLRLMKASGASAGLPDVTNCVLGLFYNSVDCEDGYFKRYVLIPKGDSEPIIAPLVTLNAMSLTLRIDLFTRRRYLDQRKIMWQAPKVPQPTVGETVTHFSKGAAR